MCTKQSAESMRGWGPQLPSPRNHAPNVRRWPTNRERRGERRQPRNQTIHGPTGGGVNQVNPPMGQQIVITRSADAALIRRQRVRPGCVTSTRSEHKPLPPSVTTGWRGGPQCASQLPNGTKGQARQTHRRTHHCVHVRKNKIRK